MPCSHGSLPLGNLRERSLEEIWNGPEIQEIRRSILANQVHPNCKCQGCPFQREDPAFPEIQVPMEIDEELAAKFDEQWYLERHEDVRRAVDNGALSSGLEHFVRHGRTEGREYRTRPDFGSSYNSDGERHLPAESRLPNNAALALAEYSKQKLIVKAYPSDIVLVVTTFCNLRCVMCPQGMGEVKNPAHTPIEIVSRAAKFIREAQRVILSGLGEPMLAPAFWDTIEMLRDKPFGLLRIHSNAHFISQQNADRIIHSGLNLLLISLDAATAATYRKIRGSDFEKPLSGIRTVIKSRNLNPESKLRIVITMTLMRDNIAEAKAFVSLAKQLEVDAAIFSQIFTFGDRPDWIVQRDGGDFVYSSQMLSKIKPDVASCLREAIEEAAMLNVKVVFHDNVDSYV
jgi:MoaA/NifB/PqqE/SkfB family radical SAM enzyme